MNETGKKWQRLTVNGWECVKMAGVPGNGLSG